MKDYATFMMGVEYIAMAIVPSMTNTISYNNTATVMHEVAAIWRTGLIKYRVLLFISHADW